MHHSVACKGAPNEIRFDVHRIVPSGLEESTARPFPHSRIPRNSPYSSPRWILLPVVLRIRYTHLQMHIRGRATSSMSLVRCQLSDQSPPFTGANAMKRLLFLTLFLICGIGWSSAAEFEKPIRLEAEDGAIRVESPGFAAPCWADIDADGNKDLLVGQFRDGKIRVYKNLGERKLAAGRWLEVDGAVAEVPGVW
jgi:hypothetical protein